MRSGDHGGPIPTSSPAPNRFEEMVPVEPDHLVLLHDNTLYLWHRITGAWTQVQGTPEVIRGVKRVEGSILQLKTDDVPVTGRIEAERKKIGVLDWGILVGYAALVVGIGIAASRRERDGEDFFLGGRSIHWSLAGLSMYATGISAISYMLIPARTFSTNWQNIGEPIAGLFAWLLVAWLAVPLLRQLPISTVYEYLERRFGLSIRLLGSATFVVAQILGRMATILLIPAQALSVVTGWSVTLCILGVGSLAILYTMLGGIKAVVWTDALQVGVIILGVLTCILTILFQVPGGIEGVMDIAREGEKLRMVDTSFRFDQETLWVFLLVGITGVFAKFGDQHTMQRAFSTPNVRDAQKSVTVFALISLPGAVLFFFLGTAFYAWYATYPESMTPGLNSDSSVLPQFTLQALPTGGMGIVMAGLFAAAMSTLDSAMNGVSLVCTRDWARIKGIDVQQVQMGRWISLTAGVAGILVSLLLNMLQDPDESLWKQIISITGLVGGGFAAVFALGFMTRRASTVGAWAGVITASMVTWGIKFREAQLDEKLIDPWFIGPLALIIALTVGYLVSLAVPHTGSLTGLTWFDVKQDRT